MVGTLSIFDDATTTSSYKKPSVRDIAKLFSPSVTTVSVLGSKSVPSMIL